MTYFVELTGCSGAGKSTLLHAVEQELANTPGLFVKRPVQLFLGTNLGARVRSESFANALLDVFLLPWTLVAVRKFNPVWKIAKSEISKRTPARKQRLMLMRSVLRKLGLAYFLQNRNRDGEVVFADEGPIHIAHVIYINGTRRVIPTRIEEFAMVVPKPDLIVFVDVEMPVLIARILARSDKPIAETDPETLTDFVERAQGLFRRLSQSPALRSAQVLELDGFKPETKTLTDCIRREAKQPIEGRM